ncbi:unnamed protein product [Pneumocystis jirovecii]|uniref:Very-long-chain (3R)-3-hydroxyacyl-CoA dehydratase n=1 Tax=Pneumocystis jirovecii TaxID=42068 RepID=L0PE76_PNEJI|nr:unnamed protein product [Pneumocystis jirovecii]
MKSIKSKNKKPFLNYLFLYNVFSCFGWIAIFFYTFIQQRKFISNYYGVISLLKYVQTFAILEILHAGLGITSSSVIITTIQVASRLLLCWGIANAYPDIVLKSSAFFSMSYAWSITEIVRYSYYANNFKENTCFLLLWLRYNLFFILYPLGTLSEMWLIWKLLPYINDTQRVYSLILKAILVIYIPERSG